MYKNKQKQVKNKNYPLFSVNRILLTTVGVLLAWYQSTLPGMTGDRWVPLAHFKGHQHLMSH